MNTHTSIKLNQFLLDRKKKKIKIFALFGPFPFSLFSFWIAESAREQIKKKRKRNDETTTFRHFLLFFSLFLLPFQAAFKSYGLEIVYKTKGNYWKKYLTIKPLSLVH